MSFSPIIEQLIERLQNRESLDLEFKDCRGDLSNDLWETVCAFANTQGGWLLIGVDKKGLPVGFDEDYANPMTGTFVRRNESDYRCNEQEVKRMFRDASAEAIDSNIIKSLGRDSLLKDSINRYRQRLQNRTPEHEFNDYDELRFLTALGAMDESGQHPTIAGLLMFGSDHSLRKWRKRHLIDLE